MYTDTYKLKVHTRTLTQTLSSHFTIIKNLVDTIAHVWETLQCQLITPPPLLLLGKFSITDS